MAHSPLQARNYHSHFSWLLKLLNIGLIGFPSVPRCNKWVSVEIEVGSCFRGYTIELNIV